MTTDEVAPHVPDDLLTNPVNPELLDALWEVGAIPVDTFREASWWVAQPPPVGAWRRILDPLALILGITLLVSGVLYLVVFNWSDLGRFSKIAVGIAPVLAIGVAAAAAGTHTLTGKVLTTAGMPLTLGLLLSIGLAYPTNGAAWPMLALWAVLCVPWAAVSRLSAGWIMVAGAVDAAFVMGMISLGPPDGLMLDGLIAGLIGIHAAAWACFGVATLAGVPGTWVWVRESLLAPVILLLAFWPIEAILSTSLPGGQAPTWLDPIGIGLFIVVGLITQVGFGLGRIRAFPAAVQLLTLLAVVTAGLGRISVELLDGVEFAGLFITVPLGFLLLIQLALSSAWLIWGWRRRVALKARTTSKRDADDAPARETETARPAAWWPTLGALLSHLRDADKLEADEDGTDVEARLIEGIRARQDASPWYVRGALFGGGLLAGGVLACTCGPLGALSNGVAFILPAVVVGIAAIGARWGRPAGWGDWLDPLLFALMIAAQLLLAVGLALVIGDVSALSDYAPSIVAGIIAVTQLALLVVFPDRWHRTLSTVLLCVCFAAISWDLSIWTVRDVGTILAALMGATLLATRPVIAGTPLRQGLESVSLGFVLYGLAGMGRFWKGWADEGWIVVVGMAVGVLALGVVAWTLARVRAPAHAWVVSMLAGALLVALGTSMPALPVALCFLLLGVLSRDVPVIVVSILALVGFGAWAYVAFDWPILLKAGALLGSGAILLGLRAYLRACLPLTTPLEQAA